MAEAMSVRLLDQLLDSIVECFTPEVAARIAALRANPKIQRRLDKLAEKNAAGTLTAQEKDEYSSCVEALDLIAILQTKARRVSNAVVKPTVRVRSPRFVRPEQAREFRKRVVPI